MRALTSFAIALSLASSLAVAAMQAPSANVQTMAGILAKLNHFPNDAEKATLGGIVKSPTATAHEKAIAQALMNMQHSVGAADKPSSKRSLKDAVGAAGRQDAGRGARQARPTRRVRRRRKR